MPETIKSTHAWVTASLTPLDDRQAKRAARRGSVRLAEETKIEALEVYCDDCRRPFDEVAGKPCTQTHWLHGGPIGERKKRTGRDGADETPMTAAAGL